MSESQAALLTAFLAKTIEIFSTTVFITFLGQVISRKAFTRSRAHGTSLVDMDLRSLVMQPGRLVTHLGSFRYSIRSTLGALTLLAMLSAMLYSTASLPVTATITTILPIYTDTPCGSQPPGSIYERSDSDQFQLYCNGYDIDFNGQGSYATSSLDFCIELCLESFDGDCAGVSIRRERLSITYYRWSNCPIQSCATRTMPPLPLLYRSHRTANISPVLGIPRLSIPPYGFLYLSNSRIC